MAYKDKEDKKEYMKQYYKDNRKEKLRYREQYYEKNHEEILTKQRQFYKERHQFTDDYKLSKGCSICGYNKCASALDFHHNGDKEFNVSRSIQEGKRLFDVKKEMEKCDVLCANCHRELHAGSN